MNRKCVLWVLVSILFFPSGVLSENHQWGGNLGLSYWHPDWSGDQGLFQSSTNGLYGPAGFVHYRTIGLGFQYFSGRFKLRFPDSPHSIATNRTDLDIILSYRIAHVFQVSALYKNIHYDWNQTYKVRSRMSGFGLGAGFNHILSERILVYGFGFYMPALDYNQTITLGGDLNGKARGLWFEGGIGYVLSKPRLVFKLGYRSQTLSIDAGLREWTEETSGFRVDMSYFF